MAQSIVRSLLRNVWQRCNFQSQAWFGLKAGLNGSGLGDEVTRNRTVFAARYLRGHGIEIGALARPLALPPGTEITYVDRHDSEILSREYSELAGRTVIAPAVVDDAETLASFAPATVDFIVANHVVEHLRNPLGFFRNAARILRDGGIIFAAIPDCENTFDADRAVTSFQHLVDDEDTAGLASAVEHFRDYVRLARLEHAKGAWNTAEEYEAVVQRMIAEDYSIHFHVWNRESITELALKLKTELGLPLRLEALACYADEVLLVMRKRGE